MAGRRNLPRHFLEMTCHDIPERLTGPKHHLFIAFLIGAVLCVKFVALVTMPDASDDDYVRAMAMIYVLL